VKKQRAFIYKCSSCGHEEPKWLGRCPECGEWNTLAETPAGGRAASSSLPIPQSLPLSSVDPLEGSRIGSGIAELDRVLGGGIMKRSAILIGGERIEIFCSGNLEEIQTIIEAVKPVLIMVDSVQTLFSAGAGLSPGTVNQMKYCSWEIISWVKEHDSAVFMAAHVTKDGLIAGPKSLEHMVDTVLYFESSDSTIEKDCRFLRAVKNRFGSVDEIGIFTMGEKGLSGVEDPSLLFLVRREGDVPPGVVTAAVLEGSRCLLVEIQALTVAAKGSMSRVFSDKIDSARVSRVAATIEKHLGLRLSDQDLYINVAGGIKITEVGVELALACAIYSARTGIPLPVNAAVAGELSLTGEVRALRRLAVRVRTARNLGFGFFLGALPGSSAGEEASYRSYAGEPGFSGVRDIKSAIKLLFSKKTTKNS
jgi:DNA repair protein RadA/Sms